MTEATHLEVVITPELAPSIYVANGLETYIQQVRDQVIGEVPDVTTKKGRERIASLAAQVSRSKTAIEKPGRDYLRVIKEAVKPAESELKRFVDQMNELRDQVRKPLNDWEKAESARIQALQDRLGMLRAAGDVTDDLGNLLPSPVIAERLNDARNAVIDDTWQELIEQAQVAKDASTTKLEQALKLAIERETQAAELARLKQEAEEKDRLAREESIRRQAAESARRIAQEEAEKKQRDALIEAARAEAVAKAAKERSEIEAKEAHEKAEREIKAANERAEREKLELIAQAKREAEEKEAARLAEEARIKAEADKREQDRSHRTSIFEEIMRNLISESGIDRAQARAVVVAIAGSKIPHTKIIF